MSVPRRTRRRIFARDQFRCYWCGPESPQVLIGRDISPRRRATLDHVIPRSMGGTNAISNLITSCEYHNAERADTGRPPASSPMPMPSPDFLRTRVRHLEPPAFPDGVYLNRHSPQYKSYRRWWRKRGFWLVYDPGDHIDEVEIPA